MESKTYDITTGEAEAIMELTGEIVPCDNITLYLRDERGRFRVTFTVNDDYTVAIVEQPYLVVYYMSEEEKEVYLETKSKVGFDRAWASVQDFLSERTIS